MTITVDQLLVIIGLAFSCIVTIGGFWYTFSQKFEGLRTEVKVLESKLDDQKEEDDKRREATTTLFGDVGEIKEAIAAIRAKMEA